MIAYKKIFSSSRAVGALGTLFLQARKNLEYYSYIFYKRPGRGAEEIRGFEVKKFEFPG